VNSLLLLHFIGHFLACILYLLLILFVLYQNPKSQLNQLCALTLAPFVIWSFAYSILLVTISHQAAMQWMNISSLGWCSFPVPALLFYRLFAGDKKLSQSRLAMTILFLIPVFFISQQWMGKLIIDVVRQPFGWLTVWTDSVQTYLFAAYYISFILVCVYSAFDASRKATKKRVKKQARILMITAAVSLSLGSVTDVIFPLLKIGLLPPLADILVLIWGFGLVYAVTRYGLMTLTPEMAANHIVDTINDSLLLVDSKGMIVNANKATYDWLGYDQDELLGREFATIISQNNGEVHLPYSKFLEDGAIPSGEYTYQTRNGKQIPILLSASIMNDNEGERLGTVAVAHDLTDYLQMKKALWGTEQKYQGLIEHALVSIGIHQDCKIVFANKNMASMFGYSFEEFIGLPIAGLIHPDERSLVLARAKDRQAGVSQPETYEIRLLKKNGSILYALISNVVIEYEGQPATLITIADIGDTKMRKELELANKELESFTYSVSHDLRAPLRSIDGFSQALLEDYEDKLDAQGKDYLQRVRAASQRMGELIDDLLNLSRVSRTELHVESVDLSEIGKAIVAELKETHPERQVEFVVQEGVTVHGDKNLLRVVMRNLLDNAWKYTGKHEHARIEFGLFWQKGEAIYFVRDDGAGFDMAYGNKLFNPFQRLHNMDEFPGTGIGLSTVQRIIHRHGGNIWAEGALEKGATFYFTLP